MSPELLHLRHSQGQHWKQHSDVNTLRDYARPLATFITSTLRSLQSDVYQYKFPLSSGAVAAGDDLITALAELPAHHDIGSELLDQLHNFLLPAFACLDSTESIDMWLCPLNCFLAINAIKPDGGFMDPHNFTSELAHWKYIIRTIASTEMVNRQEQCEGGLMEYVTCSGTALPLIIYICLFRAADVIYATHLTIGVLGPMNTVTELQQFASSLVLSEAAAPRCVWNSDFTAVDVNGIHVNVAKYRQGLRNLFLDTRDAMYSLSGGTPIPYLVPDDLADDMSNTIVGYSWLNNGQFTEVEHPLLKALMDDPSRELCTASRHGSLQWNIPEAMSILSNLADITDSMACLNGTLNSAARRGTELMDSRLENGIRARNFFRNHGQVRWVGRYTKMTNAMSRDMFIPQLCSEEMGKLNEYWCIMIKPLERTLLQVIYPNNPTRVHTAKEFAYTKHGLRCTSDQYSLILGRLLDKYCGAKLTVNPQRHLSIALKREFIPANYYVAGQNEVGDMSSAHTTSQARGTYAGNFGDLPYLTTDALIQFDEFCEEWHDLHGFGKRAPQLPLRIIQRSRAHPFTVATGSAMVAQPMFDQQQLQTLIQATVKAEINAFHTQLLPEIQKAVAAAFVSVTMGQSFTVPPGQHQPGHSTNNDQMEPLRQQPLLPSAPRLPTSVQLSAEPDAIAQSIRPSPNPSHNTVANQAFRQDDQDSSPMEVSQEGNDVNYLSDSTPKPKGNPYYYLKIQPQADLHPAYIGRERLDFVVPDPVDAHHALGDDQISEDTLLTALCRYTKRQDAQFKVPEQRQLLHAALAGQQHVVAILPTGCGKSIAFQAPPLVEPDCLTLAVIPYAAIIAQQLMIARQNGLVATQWTAGKFRTGKIPADLQLGFLAVESLKSVHFDAYVHSVGIVQLLLLNTPFRYIQNQGPRLRRIVVDEAHETMCHGNGNYRAAIIHALSLVKYPVQLIYITATFPPLILHNFWKRAGIRKETALMIRMPSNRPEITYVRFRLPKDSKKPLLVFARDLGKTVQEAFFEPDSRGIIYVHSKVDAEDLAAAIHGVPHHSGLGKEQCQINCNQWMFGEVLWIVATPGFYYGVDYPFVDCIIHAYVDGMTPFVQGVGRGGRGGRNCLTYLIGNDLPSLLDDSQMHLDGSLAAAMVLYYCNTDKCRRELITEEMDGPANGVRCTDDMEQGQCDICDPEGLAMSLAEKALLRPLPAALTVTFSPYYGPMAKVSSPAPPAVQPLPPATTHSSGQWDPEYDDAGWDAVFDAVAEIGVPDIAPHLLRLQLNYEVDGLLPGNTSPAFQPHIAAQPSHSPLPEAPQSKAMAQPPEVLKTLSELTSARMCDAVPQPETLKPLPPVRKRNISDVSV